MEISERKTKILRAVVDEYVAGAHPLSSQEIRDKHLPDLSSATVRSELSALEEMGYLVQPHTSAGRIPSTKAYKYYVDHLMTRRELSIEDAEYIRGYFEGKIMQVEDLVRRTAKVVSDMTNYTSVIVLNDIEKVRIKQIKLVDLTDGELLVVIVTDSGVIRDTTVSMDIDIGEGYVATATQLLNNIFTGRTLEEVEMPDSMIDGELSSFRQLFDNVIDALKKRANSQVYLEGGSKILDYPEYRDIDKARNMIATFDNRDELASAMSMAEDIGISLKIDKDERGGIEDCSVVTARYSIGGKEIGKVGVIGPTRMNYDKVISVLNCINEILNEGVEDEQKE